MADSSYVSIPTTSGDHSANETDVLTLNLSTMSSNDNSSVLMASPGLFARKPINLQLKNLSPVVETNNNNILSTDKTDTASTNKSEIYNSNASTTSSTQATTSTSSNLFAHEDNSTSTKLNIGFKNICYTVRTGFLRRGTKNILHGITGHFKAGELSAILGPTGAGKSTCLNILSGYRAFAYTGDVTVNDRLRDVKTFKRNVAFITQDTSLHSHLTVKEAMYFSAHLKIGVQMSKSVKRERVQNILEAIGMYDIRHTKTYQLSGGQKKRLSIALELVNNLPVLIMDEPTTGLDSSSAKQLISLLKKFALEGRTVICTIHQPSAVTLEMFDHLYAIAEGRCIYSGATLNLVPFLSELGLQCPESYNPADYLMEIATDDYGSQNGKLTERIENGGNNSYRQIKPSTIKQMEAILKGNVMANALMDPILTPSVKSNNLNPAVIEFRTDTTSTRYYHTNLFTSNNEMFARTGTCENILKETNNDRTVSSYNVCEFSNLYKSKAIYATPFYHQLGILMLRTFLMMWRDKSLATMRVSVHLITAIVIGFLYYGIGNEAENALNSFRYCFYTIMFNTFSAYSAVVIKFPLEFQIVSREHFNRWYSLRAYYVAMTMADIPIQFFCTTMYIAITYTLTDQPREFFRVILFCVIIFVTALVGQSIGLAVGASVNLKKAVVLGNFIVFPFLIFSGFFIQEQHAPEFFKWVFKISFLKHSLDALAMAVFGFERPHLDCTAVYCHYTRPKMFLRDIDMLNANYKTAIIFLVCLLLVLRIIPFYIMSLRLRIFR